ncbi:MBOAT family O-acyltransferase [Clostridium thermarum]|uniref:MBOAT family O-acyltransferase n=1 Tax=Clostridium thermarum TaxID=1716543 RepID=UPI0013D0E8BF|nr:MBOAT family O-acyltransferase [Clostridium thermarum]
MSFNSIIFTLLFLPLSLLFYNLIKEKYRNIVLLLLSIVFYLWGSPYTFSVIILSIIINYFLAIILDKSTSGKKKVVLFISIALNLILLFTYKYTNFAIDFINRILNDFTTKQLKEVKLLVPLGISYITFQQISCMVDIYKTKEKPLKSIFDFALYILFFPKLLAGPIDKFNHLAPQIRKREHTVDRFAEGIYRFSIGLGKKVILSTALEQVANKIFETAPNSLGTRYAWLGMLLYTLQIYYDFSGYTDMALGVGKMSGFELTENFNRPYIAKSISDFWKRWHISLTSFLREYVYFPLGGSRISPSRTLLNTMIIFLLSGLWHGAGYTFVVWGAYHGILSCLERVGGGKLLAKLPGFISQLWTFFLVALGWVFFRSVDLPYALGFVKTLFNNTPATVLTDAMLGIDTKFIVILIISLVMSLMPSIKLQGKINANLLGFTKSCFSLVLLIYSLALLTTGSYMPFIYFQF